MGLASCIGLSTKAGSGRTGVVEVAREDGLEEGAEDDLGTTTSYEFRVNYLGREYTRTQFGGEPSRERGRT